MYTLRNNFIELNDKSVLACDKQKDMMTLILKSWERALIAYEKNIHLLAIWSIIVQNMNLKMNESKMYITVEIPLGLILSPFISIYYAYLYLMLFPDSKCI